MDPDKAGDGVRELGEVFGTFPETFVKIKSSLWRLGGLLAPGKVGNGVKVL